MVAGEVFSAAQSQSPQALVACLGNGAPGLARLGRLALEVIATAVVFSGAALLAASVVSVIAMAAPPSARAS